MKPKQRGIFERPEGSGVWWINYHDAAGRRHREKIGRRSVAVASYEKRKQEIRENKYVPPKPDADVTFAQLAAERMDGRALHLAPASQRADQIRLGPLLAAFGSLPATEVAPQLIDKFLAGIVRSGRQKATANRYRALLSSIFTFAVRNGRVPVNPCVRVSPFKESAGRVRFLSASEEAAIREQIREASPEHECEFDLALHTGMRRGEQFQLRREGVDLHNRVLTVCGKTGQRHVPLNSVALVAAAALLEHSQGEFVGGASRPGQRDSRRWFEKAVRDAEVRGPGGVGYFRWHDLRHTFASRLVMAGVDITSVKELLGHKNIAMTLRYSHLAPEHQKANVERLADGHQNSHQSEQPQGEAA